MPNASLKRISIQKRNCRWYAPQEEKKENYVQRNLKKHHPKVSETLQGEKKVNHHLQGQNADAVYILLSIKALQKKEDHRVHGCTAKDY